MGSSSVYGVELECVNMDGWIDGWMDGWIDA